MYGRRSDARGGLIFRVAIEHEEIQVLCRHLARKCIRTDQSIAVTAERKMDWNIGCRVRSGLELANVACDRGIRGLEPVIIKCSWLQAAEIAVGFGLASSFARVQTATSLVVASPAATPRKVTSATAPVVLSM